MKKKRESKKVVGFVIKVSSGFHAFYFTTHLETTAHPSPPPPPPALYKPSSPYILSISLSKIIPKLITMRMSCNGCRVLRKGCSQNCIIRACLQWIKSPDSQANATLFLAKFYGLAGLLNLIEAGPENLRPAIFMSLLYEACGRVVNPVYGSVGMLWSRNWVECQAAVDAVLKGSQITETSSSESLTQQSISPLKTYDISHVFKDPNTTDIDKVKSRNSFKRSATKSKRHVDSKEDESMFSVETQEGSLVTQTKKGPLLKLGNQTVEIADIRLELTLGLAPATMQLPRL
ncbi:hypothetical protein ES288_A01G212300v1 [Gossypium darwinii]|uniref:LOB domain-containing protein n=1 Tax=Gossypium darwinii TaxID=34276 RepID=A0A5D2HPS5_GOSDA|nr:hypothetical protein ES288_A01G212300v1 [Gossypium darwinii]